MNSATTKENKFDLVIVGAGPAGLTAACLAEKKGLSVIVLEKNTRDTYHGYAHYLNAQSLGLLANLGIDLHQLSALAIPDEQALSMAYGHHLQSIFKRVNCLNEDWIDASFYQYGPLGASINLGYQTWRPLLLDKIDQAGIEVHWQTQDIKLDLERQTLSYTHLEQKCHLTFEYCIASDGSHSNLRQQLKPTYAKKPTNWQRFLSLRTEANLSSLLDKPALLYWLYQPDASCCMVNHPDTQVWQIPLSKNQTKPNLEECSTMIADFCGIKRQELADIDCQLTDQRVWHMQTHCLEHIRHGPVFFVGDSAHCMTPAGGLGLNTALGDVENLIWKLARHKQTKQSYWLNSYDFERGPLGLDRVEKSISNYKNFLAMPEALGIPMQHIETIQSLQVHLKTIYPKPLHHCIKQTGQYLFEGWCELGKQITPIKKAINQAAQDNLEHFYGAPDHLNFIYAHKLDCRHTDYKESKNQLGLVTNQKLLTQHKPSESSAHQPPALTGNCQPGTWAGYLKYVSIDKPTGPSQFITEAQCYQPIIICRSLDAYHALTKHYKNAGSCHEFKIKLVDPHTNKKMVNIEWDYCCLRPDLIVYDTYTKSEKDSLIDHTKILTG